MNKEENKYRCVKCLKELNEKRYLLSENKYYQCLDCKMTIEILNSLPDYLN